MDRVEIEIPPKLLPVFLPPRGSFQYRALHGGRGSGKSVTCATMALLWGYKEPLRILCARDLQVSIKESFHAELKMAAESRPWLAANYEIGVDYLRGKNGTEFLFRGLRHNTNSIKSLAKIDLTIVEEAEDTTEESWLALEATVLRQPKAEIWPIWNPRLDGSPVDQRFIKSPPKNSTITEINYSDNPFFPEGLESLRQQQQERLDPATYAHIWEGAYLTNSDAQVFANKIKVEQFEPSSDWDGPYCGGDFGFSQDPTAAVMVWLHNGNIYIEYEAVKIGLELDDTSSYVNNLIPNFDRYVSRWDNSRPESISHLTRHGLPRAISTAKWAGSVEDGISFLRSFKNIIIHPRCSNMQQEARLYSYKVDRLSGDIKTDIVDSHNHGWDAVRYALSPLIKEEAQPSSSSGFVRGLY